MKQFNNYFLLILTVAFIMSCKAYKQDIMFKLDDNFTESDLNIAVKQAERNYVIQVNDLLSLDVYTNKGERIIDPNNALTEGGGQLNQNKDELTYLVKVDGRIKFPIIGQVDVDSLTIDQAEQLLQVKYNEYYKDSFVKLEYQNKRVVVLGAVGGQIIPLSNENLSLVEILALSGGLEMGSKAQNIKVIRAASGKMEVYQVNLSTIDGMKKSMLDVQPGDIIYVEPWRRPWLEALKDIAPVMSMMTSTLALILVIQTMQN